MRTLIRPRALAAGLVLAGPPALCWAGPPDAPATCCPPDVPRFGARLFGHKPTPPVVEPAPLGLYVRAPFEVMVSNGAAAKMTLYDYDFVPGREQLSLRGRDRVRQIADLAQCNGFPIVIQRTLSPQLSEARRLAVTAELLAINSVAAGRVVVGIPAANPLRGIEAELIFETLRTQTEQYGSYPPIGSQGGGFTPGGGGSGGGGATGGRGTGGTGTGGTPGR